MTEKDIKPIPKYIMDEIYKRDLKIYPWQEGTVRFYAYLAIWKKELVKVTVAVTKQKKQWCCKQVAVHGVHSDKCLVRDMEYNYFGYGYRVGWFAEELQSVQKRFEDGKWYAADTKYYDPYAPLINRGVIAKIPEYKYSAYQHYTGRDIISYLRIYERFPQTEYMLKNGLCAYAENITLLKKFGKDKKFCKWFIRHRKELALPYGNTYNVTTIREAYKTGRPLKEVRHFLFVKKQFERNGYSSIRNLFPGWKLKTYFDYIEKKRFPTACISTISMPAITSAWICRKSKTCSRPISAERTISASDNIRSAKRLKMRTKNRNSYKRLQKLRKNTCRSSIISAAPLSALSPNPPPT